MVDGRAIPGADDAATAAPAVAEECSGLLMVLARLLQQRHHTCREIHRAAPGIGFRISDVVSLVGRVLQGAVNVDGAFFPIHIGQLQRTDLAQAQTAEERKQHSAAERQGLFAGKAAQQLHGLPVVEKFDLLFLHLRTVDAIKRIRGKILPLHGLVEHVVDAVIVMAHGAVGQLPGRCSFPVAVGLALALLRLQRSGAGRSSRISFTKCVSCMGVSFCSGMSPSAGRMRLSRKKRYYIRLSEIKQVNC